MKKEEIEKPDEQLGFLLMQTSLLKQRIVNAALRELDITYIQFVVLAGTLELGADEDMLTQQTIATRRRLDKAMVSNVIKTLINKGLIIRENHPLDSRAFIIRLTEAGEKTAIQAKSITRWIDNDFFACIDKEMLKDVLKKVLSINSDRYGED